MRSIIDTQRELTEWFIDNGPPSLITLVPQTKVQQPGKGVKTVPGTPRPEQKFKKIWPGGDGLQTGGQDGTHHRFDMIIVGLYDCQAEIGDIFTEGNQKYIIHSEFPNNNYERKFGVYSYGNRPSDG